MMSNPFFTRLRGLIRQKPPEAPRSLTYWHQHRSQLPDFVHHSPVAEHYLPLLGPLDWDQIPLREGHPNGQSHPLSTATLAAAILIQLDQQRVSISALHRYLAEHPELVWLLGFPLHKCRTIPRGFDPQASLPTARHLTRLLRITPNQVFQFLLDNSVTLIQQELAEIGITLGEVISLDTKHILAWVKENNPKAYSDQRFDKQQQPAGDPDCKLGCKRKHNQRRAVDTPDSEALPARNIPVGEYYWGYASGIVVTKVPEWGEIVLAEMTQPFDQADISYFFPLMNQTARRLGHKPLYGAFDAAFDAFYVYEYFHSLQHKGFAAVPFSERGGHRRSFDHQGLPICPAGLAMPLKSTFICKTTLVEHQRGRYVCPLLYPSPAAQSCPINHKRWSKGGCRTTLPTSIGARLRYQLDRHGESYKVIYNQRSAIERINSQAKELGIERPKLRNQQAIANHNTLIYVLINLRALQRIRQRRKERQPAEDDPIRSPEC